jgi:phosphoglycerol transferase MdoB-like AlkP superfamily enzyme
MKKIMLFVNNRFAPVLLQFYILFAAFFLTRLGLLVISWPVVDAHPLPLLEIFVIGFLFDFIASVYFSIPLILYCWLVPQKIFIKRVNTILLYVYFFISTFLILFNVISEYFFWQEFQVRYNFIAVDYLIYTNEVIANIKQSYPIYTIVIILLLITTAILFLLKRPIQKFKHATQRFGERTLIALSLLLIAVACYFYGNERWENFSTNKIDNELAGNGLYQFGYAFRNNTLSYKQFYKNIDDSEAFATAKNMLADSGATYISNNPFNLSRNIITNGPAKKLNVVLITIESLSADHIGYFKGRLPYTLDAGVKDTLGHSTYLTPNFDSLIDKSLFLTNFYASGTRTVRGLEAVSTGIVPTPGQSVVKRLPTREGLFTIGSVLKNNGYDTKYIYGGNSFFDNMGDFFSKNGYEVIDEDAIAKKDIHHETAWGVCDEDLYTLALKEMDKTYATGQLFFHHLMTVSHHRPYTYPRGRVSINPNIKRREGTLQYTDYAIGKFLQQAKTKPWFANTIFVIMADHCASSSGRTDMPLNRYHIPCWIYAPNIITPGKYEKLTAQIDILPTILALLNISYPSRFYGKNIFTKTPADERALMVSYQDVAYVKNNQMVVLSPQKKVKMYKPDFKTGDVTVIPVNNNLVKEAISYFQTASYLLDSSLYKSFPKNK